MTWKPKAAPRGSGQILLFRVVLHSEGGSTARKDFGMETISLAHSADKFCHRFKGYHYMSTAGNDPFKTGFIIDAILNVPFCIITTLANVLVIISIWRSYQLRTPANMLLIGLALSDLGVGLVVQPFFIAYLLSFAFHGADKFTCICAVGLNLTASCLTCVSFGTVTAISVERYLSLHLHLRYEEIFTVKRVRRFLVVLWLLGGLSPIILVFFVPEYKSHYFVVGIALCLLISTVAYVKIHRIVRSHLRQIEANDVRQREVSNNFGHRKKSAYNMFLVYCVLICCYAPYLVSLALGKIAGYTKENWTAIHFALTIVNINSTLNPIIYCYRMRDIRRAMFHTLYTTLRCNK